MSFHYQIKFLDKSREKPTPQELINVNRQTESLKFNRGNILDYINEIEVIIHFLIEDSIIHKRSKLWRVFRSNVLNNKNVTLKNKIDLLCAIIDEKKELKMDALRALRKSLDSLREERNKWAHGIIHFKEEKKSKILHLNPYLNWINSEGKESEISIEGLYFDELVEKLKTSQEILGKILRRRRHLPKIT